MGNDDVDLGWYEARERSEPDTAASMVAFQNGLTGSVTVAISSFGIVTKRTPEVGDGWVNLGVSHEKNGNLLKALSVYKSGLSNKKCSSNCKSKTSLAACTLLLQLYEHHDVEGARESAFPICAQSLQLQRQTPTSNLIQSYSNMATLYSQMQQFTESKMMFKEIINNQPTYNQQLWLNYANTCIRSGDTDEAIRIINEQISTYKDDSYLVYRLASTIYTTTEVHSKTAISYAKAGLKSFVDTHFSDGLKLVYENDKFLSKDKNSRLVHQAETCYGMQTNPFVASGSKKLTTHPPVQFPDKNIYIRSYYWHFLVGESGLLVSNKSIYTGDHLHNAKIPEETTALQTFKIIRHEEAEVATLLQLKVSNHYHWVIEVLSRAVVMQQAHPGITFVLNDNNPVITESFEILFGQNSPSKLLILHSKDNIASRTQRHLFPLVRRVLFGLSQDEKSSKLHINDPWYVYYPSAKAMQLLREAIQSDGRYDVCESEDDNDDGYVLFISRSQDSARQIIGENILLDEIRRSLRKPFQRLIVFRPSMALRQQFKLFQGASVVVGPHGAGLSNIVASKPETPIILFPMNPPSDNVWAHMAAALQHPYWIVPSLSSFYYTSYESTDKNIKESLDTILEVLVGLGKSDWLKAL